jgi:uncharacterized membrane protein YoaK (UPF0700 family)
MMKTRSVESMLPVALLGMTAVTGLVDAVSFLSLGRVFTANMTGNVVFIAFAAVGVPGLSLARSTAALLAFLAGAAVGGRIMARATADAQTRAALTTFALEAALLVAATGAALGFSGEASSPAPQVYALIVLTALAMGIRNASVRKLGVPDLTTTVLTLTLTGLAAESTLAGGANPRWQRRVASIVAMFAGAAVGAWLVRTSVSSTLALAAAVSIFSGLVLRLAVRSVASSPSTSPVK